MPEKVIRLTGLHSLKSDKMNDYSRYGPATYVQFNFGEYEVSECGKLEWTGQGSDYVISVDDILQFLREVSGERKNNEFRF